MTITPLDLFVATTLGSLPRPAAPLRALLDLERALWWCLVAALLVVFWLLRRWASRRRPRPVAIPAPATTDAPASAFRVRVESLRHRIDESGEYRRGCHTLARHVREELQSTLGTGARSLAMTATELAHRSADPKVDALVLRLREVRFARDHPRGPQFHALCNDALYALDRDGE